jgi:hypothetical protein
MKKVIRLTESELTHLVKKIIKESENKQAEIDIENCDENDDMAMEMCVEKLFADMSEEEAENYVIELSRRKPKWLAKLARWFRRTGRKIKRAIRRAKPGEKILNVGAALTFATLATFFMTHVREITDKMRDMVGGNSRMDESDIRRILQRII